MGWVAFRTRESWDIPLCLNIDIIAELRLLLPQVCINATYTEHKSIYTYRVDDGGRYLQSRCIIILTKTNRHFAQGNI